MSTAKTQKTPGATCSTLSKSSSKGASQSRTSFGDKAQSYLGHHRLVAQDSFQRLLKSFIPSVMTWLVIGIALALPTGLFVTLGNVESVSRSWDGAAQLSLFLHKAVAEEDGRKLADNIRLRDDVADVEYISRAQALEEFQSLAGYGDVLQVLDANPLPSVIVVIPVEEDANAAAIAQLFAAVQAMPQVQQASLDMEWVQRLYSMMDLGRRMTLALAGLLSLGVIMVIGNTIRLTIESRRDEIVIVKLVGGTNAFVRRPFLYTGLWYGFGGGIVSWLIVAASLLWLASPVAELAGLYESDFKLVGLGVGASILLWVVSGLLGLLGAWLAVSRHLGSIKPN